MWLFRAIADSWSSLWASDVGEYWEDEYVMATTAQLLNSILSGVEHNHDLLHLLLRRQGVTKEQLDQLLESRTDAAAWEREIDKLTGPTAAVEKALKDAAKNQS